jgi:hypothetical protein
MRATCTHLTGFAVTARAIRGDGHLSRSGYLTSSIINQEGWLVKIEMKDIFAKEGNYFIIVVAINCNNLAGFFSYRFSPRLKVMKKVKP